MQREAVEAMYHALHKDRPWHDGLFRIWMTEQSALTPFHYTHGVGIRMTREDLTPDDDWLGQKRDALPGG